MTEAGENAAWRAYLDAEAEARDIREKAGRIARDVYKVAQRAQEAASLAAWRAYDTAMTVARSAYAASNDGAG